MIGVVIRKPWSKCIAQMAVNNYLSNKLSLHNGGNEATELEIMEIYLIFMILSFSFASERIAMVQEEPKDEVIRWARSNRIAVITPISSVWPEPV